MKQHKYYEIDLALPIKLFLEKQGFLVHSEVRGCDLTATKDDHLVIVELKRNCSINLLIQAIRRQQLTDDVYLAFPKPTARELRSSHWKGVLQLITRLELGLLLVSFTNPPIVEIVLHPASPQLRKKNQERQAVLKEISGRFDDYNQAGSTQCKIYTAYREEAIFVACCLAKFEILSPQAIQKLGTSSKTNSILSNNFYGWFERIARGRYTLTSLGKSALTEYPELVRTINDKLDNMENLEKLEKL